MPGTSFSTANWSGYDEHSGDISPGGALTDYSSVIDLSRLSATLKATVQSDFGDLRFTDESDSEIPFVLIDPVYNSGAITGAAVVKCSLAASTSSQKIRVWAGYTLGTAVAYDANETYGSDNAFDSSTELVWPLAADFNDLTANGLDGTEDAGMTAGGASGPGLGIDGTTFDGVNNHVLRSAVFDPTGTGLTIAGWYKRVGGIVPFSLRKDSQNRFYVNTISGQFVNEVNNIYSEPGASAGSDGVWQHQAITYDDVDAKIFVNGSLTNTSNKNEVITSGDWSFAVSREAGTTYGELAGDVCFVTVHSTPRSATWIAHDHDQADQSTLYGTWSWTAGGGGGGSAVPIIRQRY